MIKQTLVFAALATLTMYSCSTIEEKTSPEGRAEYEHKRLQDPVTGKIPENIRVKELALASKLPKTMTKTSRASLQVFEPIGPRNVGGRTRAVSFHIDKPNVFLAGGVSGGMWRSEDKGLSWKRATNYEDHSAVSCIAQDLRPGKSNIFYYGSGEVDGNSASKSFSAYYRGNGIYKSTDDGITWQHIPSTAGEPHKANDWSAVVHISLDQSRNDSDIIYAATSKGIQRSNNGGTTWKLVLTATTAEYCNIVTTTTGIHYATISSEANNKGFYRSVDGLNWTNISPSDLPGTYGRTLMAVAPSNENIVYFYSDTPNSGKSGASVWRYTYQSGNGSGSGGTWENESSVLPTPSGQFYYDLNTFDGYCMSLAVKPNNTNLIYVGGTNLFELNFMTNSEKQIGGYRMDNGGDVSDGKQHADQQMLAFDPHNPEILLAGTDGGVHYTTNVSSTPLSWTSFNNGYQTSQFYGTGIDHKDENEIVLAGFQDNGSWWTSSADTNVIWSKTNGGDGSYCAMRGGTDTYYFSSQNGNIRKMNVDQNGNTSGYWSVRPNNTSGYLFNHPYILNPADENQMYLPITNTLWRHSNLASQNKSLWVNIGQVGDDITALAASPSDNGIVYIGTDSRRIHRVEDNGSSSAIVTDITGDIKTGSYTSCIAVHPTDPDIVMVVYSNYNVISAWYTEDAGVNWKNIEGNLKGDPDPGVPPQFDYIGNGPSFRWARFIPTDDGMVYMVGTSIGLFATDDLSATDVNWIQQASDVIGNVVIEQIDSRDSDGFCVVATHGTGAYKTYFENSHDITSTENVTVNPFKVRAYPNPVVNHLSFEYDLNSQENVRFDVISANGSLVKTQFATGAAGKNNTQIDMSTLENGMYYVRLHTSTGDHTEPIIKR